MRRELRGRLPDYMVPAAFVELEVLPRNVHGKLDRRSLPAPGPERPELEASWVATRTPTEEALAAIWATVLGLERVGAEDDFFELGGHSLLLTQVVARVKEQLEVDLPLRQFFDAPSLAEVARAVERLRWVAAGTGADAEPIGEDEEEGEL